MHEIVDHIFEHVEKILASAAGIALLVSELMARSKSKHNSLHEKIFSLFKKKG